MADVPFWRQHFVMRLADRAVRYERGVDLARVVDWLGSAGGCLRYGPARVEWCGLSVEHDVPVSTETARRLWAAWWTFAQSVDADAIPVELRGED